MESQFLCKYKSKAIFGRIQEDAKRNDADAAADLEVCEEGPSEVGRGVQDFQFWSAARVSQPVCSQSHP